MTDLPQCAPYECVVTCDRCHETVCSEDASIGEDVAICYWCCAAIEDDNALPAVECPVCIYPNEPMGVLGRTVHFRCRACGIPFHLTLSEKAYERRGGDDS